MRDVIARAERYFEFDALRTSWKTEILAGVTTFVTMAYIIFVNPSILHETGMPAAAVTAATCLAAAVGSLLMGAFARYPIALAPGMGLNAYFTYSVVKGMGVDWRVALGAVFLSGIAFLILTAAGVRQTIVHAIPHELYAAVAAGVGLFIALIGLKNAGIVEGNSATLVGLGDLHAPSTLLALFGLLLTATLLCAGQKAAILIGALVTWLLAAITGVTHWNAQPYSFAAISATAGKLDIRGALSIGFVEIIFVFLFVDLFDNVGTLLAVGKKAELFTRANDVPRMKSHILYKDVRTATVRRRSPSGNVDGRELYIAAQAGVAAGEDRA